MIKETYCNGQDPKVRNSKFKPNKNGLCYSNMNNRTYICRITQVHYNRTVLYNLKNPLDMQSLLNTLTFNREISQTVKFICFLKIPLQFSFTQQLTKNNDHLWANCFVHYMQWVCKNFENLDDLYSIKNTKWNLPILSKVLLTRRPSILKLLNSLANLLHQFRKSIMHYQ